MIEPKTISKEFNLTFKHLYLYYVIVVFYKIYYDDVDTSFLEIQI